MVACQISRSESISGRSERIEFLTPSTSLLAVATTGTFVVCRRCRVSAKPMPRLAGQTKDQATVRYCKQENNERRKQAAFPCVQEYGGRNVGIKRIIPGCRRSLRVAALALHLIVRLKGYASGLRR